MKKCVECQENKTKGSFWRMAHSSDGLRPECAECSKKRSRKFEKENPIRDRCNRMADGILQRTVYEVNNTKNRTYKDNNIISEIGSDRVTISNYLYDNFREEIESLIDKGEKPSVDRIDPKRNYMKGNIRIIPLRDNYLEGLKNAVKKTSKQVRAVFPDGTEKVYVSVSQASRELKRKRDTIIRNRDNGTETRDGIRFYNV